MKKIELPLTRRFYTPVIDMEKAHKELASGEKQIISLGTIDFGENGEDLDQARINGGIIIWSAICIEEKIETIITNFLFSSGGEEDENKGKQFFSSRIIKANHFSYSTKKNLLVEIVNNESLLKGRKKDELGKSLKDVMDFRNAFAHGDINFEAEKGCVLSYWRGDTQSDILTEEYWGKVESCFNNAHNLIEEVLANQK